MPWPRWQTTQPNSSALVRNRRMRAVRLDRNVRQSGFLERTVASRAAIDHAHLGQPDLLNAGLKVAAQA